MKKALLLFCFSSCLHASAQLSGKAVDLRDMTGKPIVAGSSEIKGSPFLNEQWGTGYVKFGNGRVIKDVPLRFNLVSNELSYQVDGNEFTFIEPASEFSIVYKNDDDNKDRQSIFRNGYPGAKPTEKHFFEVLADGPRFQLLKRMYKSVVESSGYGAAPVKAYKPESDLFIYDAQTASLSFVKNKRPLAESVPVLAKNLEGLPGNENGKFRSEKELIELFTKLNIR